MSVAQSRGHDRHGRSRSPLNTTSSSNKPPCKLCQRSRWLMVITVLVLMASVTWLNAPL